MKSTGTILKAMAVTAALLCSASQADAQLLYKVEKAGSDKTSYILGTHHFASVSVVDSIASIPQILKDVDKLYGEIDMEAMKDPSMMMAMQQQLMAPADSTLDKIFTPAQLDSIGQVVTSYAGQEVPLQMMNMFKPSVISTQLGQLISAKVFPDLNPLENIDISMQNRMRELGKPVLGFETMQSQLDLIYNRPISEQAEGLMKSVREPQKQEEMGLKLSNAYKNHDINAILSLMIEEEDEDPEALDEILYNRNDNWVNQLKEILPAESVFVVVGAGHLPGDRGVLNQLQQAGYTITAVQ